MRDDKNKKANIDARRILRFMALFLNGAYYTRTLFSAAMIPFGGRP